MSSNIAGQTYQAETKQRSEIPYFFLGMGVLLSVCVMLGFWPTYFGPLLSGDPMSVAVRIMGMPAIIHLHAAVFLGWTTLLVLQATLIRIDHIKKHMTIGKVGIGVGALLVILGLTVWGLVQHQRIIDGELTLWNAPVKTMGVWLQMVNFSILIFLGYKNRHRPAFHKRYMLFTTIAIMPAAIGRMHYLFPPGPAKFLGTLGIFAGLLAAIMLHDYWAEKRIHKASLIGSGLIVLDIVALIFLGS